MRIDRCAFIICISYSVNFLNKIIEIQITGMLCNMNWFLLSSQIIQPFCNNEVLNCENNCPPMKANHTSLLKIHYTLSNFGIVLRKNAKSENQWDEEVWLQTSNLRFSFEHFYYWILWHRYSSASQFINVIIESSNVA